MPIDQEAGVPTLKGLENVFTNIVTFALGGAGIAFFVLLVVGGFKYLTAGGEPPAIESARKTLTYAIAGLVLVALSFLIMKFIQAFTGVDVTQFKVRQ